MKPHEPWALAASLAVSSACNHVPVSNLDKTFTLKVEARTGDDEAVEIDFLWVVDNSSSMCQEQRALSENFQKFVASLEDSFDVDARFAVTSVDAQSQNDDKKVFSARGKFNQHVDRNVLITCAEGRYYPCKEDTDCTDAAVLGSETTSGAWKCSGQDLDVCITNPDGSFNTACRRASSASRTSASLERTA